MNKACVFFIILLNFTFSFSQSFQFDQSIKVNAGKEFGKAWAGGLNSCQYSTIDLNMDGIEDLVVFDRTNNKFSTFIVNNSSGNKSYSYAPEYECFLPLVENWVLFRDYNGDGKKDIFSYATFGIEVYKNISTGIIPQWKLVKEYIETKTYSNQPPVNLALDYVGLPAIEDTDNDGDLDILIYDYFDGTTLTHHQNVSKEKYGNADSLEYKWTGCFGNFQSGHIDCNTFDFGTKCTNTQNKRVAHVPSHSILLLDKDGDKDKDAVIGESDCKNLAFLENKGTPSSALMTSFTLNFPQASPINLNVFPSAFYEDVDFDGKRDLLVTPTISVNTSGAVDFFHSNYFYKNVNTDQSPIFDFQQTDFLQNDMLEVGDYASPAFADYDADGDMDLFVGNRWGTNNNSTNYASVFLFKNTGTKNTPSFSLVNNDFLGLSNERNFYIKPIFTDYNSDGKMDFLFTCYDSTGQAILKAIYNISTSASMPFLLDSLNKTPQTIPGLAVYDIPLFYDMDNDTDKDLLLAKSAGKLQYYENIGDNNFDLAKDTLGGIKNNYYTSNLSIAIADVDHNGQDDLLGINHMGNINIYNNFLSNLNKVFTAKNNVVLNGLNQSLTSPYFGLMANLAAADLNDDSYPEIIVGSLGGGLIYLRNTTITLGLKENTSLEDFNVNVFPNPSKGEFIVRVTDNYMLDIIDIYGRIIKSNLKLLKGVNNFYMSDLQKGVYLLKISSESGVINKKLIME